MDRHSKEQRRRNMQAIKSSDTKIELLLRRELWKRGYRYRKNYAPLPGRPDVVFLRKRVAVFCDGEFWHGYKWNERKHNIKSNREFWISKIENNMRRDDSINRQLKKAGWKVLRFWETDLLNNMNQCVAKIEKLIAPKLGAHNKKGKFIDRKAKHMRGRRNNN